MPSDNKNVFSSFKRPVVKDNKIKNYRYQDWTDNANVSIGIMISLFILVIGLNLELLYPSKNIISKIDRNLLLNPTPLFSEVNGFFVMQVII